jgi:tetratricopeptide (TPR) repeat protein
VNVSGQIALADRAAEMAQLIIRDNLGDSAFRQAAALLEAATRLDPNDPRYWRLLTDAKLQLGDRAGALAALAGYRAIAPHDAVAQVQVIGLHAAGLQTVDDELKYYRGLIAREGEAALPDEVRSQVSLLIAQRLIERGEHAAAVASLDEAIKLNPVNVSALELKYRAIAGSGAEPERAAALIDLIRANPVQPWALAEMGRLLAAVGQSKEAAEWMNKALALHNRAGVPDPAAYRALGVDYASQLYVGGQLQTARTLTDQILKGNPNDIDAWLVRLVVERGGKEPETYDKAKEGAAAAFNNNWAAAARFVSGEPAPDAATEGEPPAPAEAPADPAEVAKQVQAANDPAKRDAFVAAASDLAWFEIYFNENPGAAGKWVDALEGVVPEDNLTLKRLRGWLMLANKQTDEARRTLEPLAPTDPLSALGMVRLAGEGKEAQASADDLARQLLQDNPSGLVGAILAQGLKDRAVKPEPHPDATAVRAAVMKLPRGWLDLAERPERYYSIRVEPRFIAHRYGDPMYVIVTLRNLTDQPLPVADNGVINPGIWFDASVQAMESKMLSGVAFERMARTTILPPKAGFQQMVRLDQGNLALLLAKNPTPRMQVTGWATTNTMARGQGFAPGPAGVKVPFARKMTRVGFQLGKEEQRLKLYQEIEQGLAERKIRNLSMLAAYIPILRGQAAGAPAGAEGQPVPPPDPAAEQQRQTLQQLADEMMAAIVRASADPTPSVAQWARFELTRVGDAQQAVAAVQALIEDPAWEGRMLGLVAVRQMPGLPNAIELAEKVASAEAEEPFVKTFAAEVAELLKNPPAPPAPAEGEAAPPADGAAPAPQPAPTEQGPSK